MKINLKKSTKGLTLIEMTIVILIILSLIGVLFIGFKFYKDGADKATCLARISNAQKEVRSYQNMKLQTTDDDIVPSVMATAGLTTIQQIETGKDNLCPGGGSYAIAAKFPAVGTAAVTCSGGAADNLHKPESTDGW